MRYPRETTRTLFSHDTPDVTQGEHHLMADALLAAERGTKVPVEIICRAVGVLHRLDCMSGKGA